MISVVVCTYNRCASLRRTLETFSSVEGAGAVPWELLVVDNNSRDETRDTVSTFVSGGRLPLSYLLEKKQGLSHARNCGVAAARGEFIAFTDDDVLVDRQWLVNLHKAWQELDAACIGGKILPSWEKDPPPWLGKELHGYLALLDLGDRRLRMTEPNLWGANLAFRADIFRRYGQFDPTVGRIGSKLYSSEETLLLQALLDQGEPVYYCPEVLVHHWVPVQRMQKKYFRKWFFDGGELEGLLLGEYAGRNLQGIPLYAFTDLVQRVGRCVKAGLTRSNKNFPYQLDLFKRLGFMRGRLKYMRQKRSG